MAKVLVTGVAGFIGSHTARSLLAGGHEVVGIDDFSRGFKRNIPSEVTFFEGDLKDADFVSKVFSDERPEYVVHVAAYSAVGFSHVTKIRTNEENVLVSARLINESVNYGVKCFVFVSSISVYNPHSDSLVEDSLDLKPAEPYGLTKLSTEHELRITHEKFGLKYVIVRPFNVYGECQHIGDANRNVVGIFMRKALRGEPLTIIGDGENKLAFTHIDDLAPVIAKLPFNESAHNRVYNLGSEEVNSLNDLANQVSQLSGGSEITRINPTLRQPDLICSVARAKAELGYVPSISFSDGLKRMWDWAKGLEEIKDVSVTSREITV